VSNQVPALRYGATLYVDRVPTSWLTGGANVVVTVSEPNFAQSRDASPLKAHWKHHCVGDLNLAEDKARA